MNRWLFDVFYMSNEELRAALIASRLERRRRMTLEERAKAIAEKANECCYRSDGFKKAIEEFTLKHLREAIQDQINLDQP